MKEISLKRILGAALLSIATLSFQSTAFAKEISLYESPKADAKVVGKIDLSAGIVPIYTPSGGEWIKVGDPRNGNVGWIKSNEIQPGSSVTFTQRLINDGEGTQSYQKIEFGKPTAVDIEKIKENAKKMQAEQAAIQKALTDMMDKMNKVYQQEMDALSKGQFPVLLPIIVPEPIIPAKPKTTLPAVGTPAAQPTTPAANLTPSVATPAAAESSTPVKNKTTTAPQKPDVKN